MKVEVRVLEEHRAQARRDSVGVAHWRAGLVVDVAGHTGTYTVRYDDGVGSDVEIGVVRGGCGCRRPTRACSSPLAAAIFARARSALAGDARAGGAARAAAPTAPSSSRSALETATAAELGAASAAAALAAACEPRSGARAGAVSVAACAPAPGRRRARRGARARAAAAGRGAARRRGRARRLAAEFALAADELGGVPGGGGACALARLAAPSSAPWRGPARAGAPARARRVDVARRGARARGRRARAGSR